MKNLVRSSLALLFICAIGLLTSCEEENLDDQVVIPTGQGGDEYDCEALELNIGDTCEIGNELGTVNENCECIEETQSTQCDEVTNLASWYDSEFPDGYELSPGDQCWDSNEQQGVVNENCECEAQVQEFDCPNLQANVGDACETPGTPFGGVVNADCECEGETIEYDCPELQANIGMSCVDIFGNFGVIDENCECLTNNGGDYDCPNMQGNVGDPCQAGWGIIDQHCDCIENNPATLCTQTSNLASWYDLEFPNGYFLEVGADCWTSSDEQGTVNQNCECEAN